MMNRSATGRQYVPGYFFALVSLAVMAYVVIRAAIVPINYDESLTLRMLVPQSVWEIISFETPIANNHLVNTLLVKFLSGLNSKSLFLIRLPNVLAAAVYLYFAVKLCRKYFSVIVGCCCFLLLVCNPFLLDFFGMARGYGLTMAFYLGALYQIVKYVKDGEQRSGFYSLLLCGIAVLCCFCMVNFWLISLGFFVLMPLVAGKTYPSRRPFISYFVVFFLLLATLWEPVRKLTKDGQLFYGGMRSLYHDTLLSVTKYTLYEHMVSPSIAIALNCFLIVFAIAVLGSLYYERKLITVKNVLLAMLLLCLLAIELQFRILGTPYIIDRTALFLFPLFILVLCFSLDTFRPELPGKLVVSGVALAFLVNFFLHANFYKQVVWYYEAHTPRVLAYLNELGRKQNRVIVLGSSPIYNSSFSYYFERERYPFLKTAENLTDMSQQDYHLRLAAPLDVVYYPEMDPITFFEAKKLVKEYPDESVELYRILKRE